MTVNAAVLCTEGLCSVKKDTWQKQSIGFYKILRRKMPALLATTITTVSGVLPFLFLSEGVNSLIRTLSIVSALGVTSSFFCSISIVPSIAIKLSKF
jgi:predicted RND superfamily exporter protein